MTKQAALYQFFSSFGIPAYTSTSVPDDATFPWLTYESTVSNWGDSDIPIVVNLWYHTESESEPNAMVEKIRTALNHGGVTIPCDDGAIWIRMGSPWCQSLSDADDPQIKRKYLSVVLEFLTL